MFRFLTLFRLEAVKLTHRKVFFFAFVALAIVSALFVWGFSEVRFPQRFHAALQLMGIKLENVKNGLFCAEFAVYHSFMVLLPIFSSVIGGHLLASEAKEGTLRAVLMRPVGRIELGAVKVVMAIAYLLAVNVFFAALTLGIAVPIYGSGEFLTLNFQRGEVPPIALLSSTEGLTRMALSCLLAAGAMLPVLALSFMFSAMFDNPVVVTVGGLTTYLILEIFNGLARSDEMAIFRWMEPYLFPHYMGFWKQAFQPRMDWKAIGDDLCTCGAFSWAFVWLGLGWFRWKDIRS